MDFQKSVEIKLPLENEGVIPKNIGLNGIENLKDIASFFKKLGRACGGARNFLR